MRQHKWTVGKLCEMDPSDDKLKQEGACTLGYNENSGFRIFIRLRTDDLRGLRPYRGLVNTLLHELTHNMFGPHTEPFWRLFSQLKTLYLRTHAELQRQGTILGGQSVGSLADLAQTGDAQNIGGALVEELAGDAANGALKPHERAAAALVAREQIILNQMEETSGARAPGRGWGSAGAHF